MDNLSDKSLVKDVFQILDSRIQYIDYQLGKLSRQSLQSNLPPESGDVFSMEMTFKQIELHNRSLKLLLLFRSHLNILNAPIIFDLLTDSRYLDYDEVELKVELGLDVSEPSAGERLLSSNR